MNAPTETQKFSSLAASFVKAQKAFGPALKTKENGGFKGSRYADLASCVEAVLAALNNNGLGLIQIPSQTDSDVSVETVLLYRYV